MTKPTEFPIEDFAIKLFECLGNDRVHAPDGNTLLPMLTNGETQVTYEGIAS